MKYKEVLSVWVFLYGCCCHAQRVGRAMIEDPMRLHELRMAPNLMLEEPMRLLEPLALDRLSGGLRSKTVAAAVNTELSSVSAKLATQERMDIQAAKAGIDLAVAPASDPVGPHLLTQSDAFDIERAGRAFLETSSGTAKRLNVPVKEAGAQFTRARIMPPNLLPDRLRCPYEKSKWPSCASSDKYRTYDGSCNNLKNALWGRSMTPFERTIPPWYDDGISTPRQRSFGNSQLPNPRKVSFEFHQPLSRFMPDLNHFAMEYGQFLSHDIQFNALSRGYGNTNLDCCRRPNRPNCFPIMIPSDDPFFNRSCMNFVRALPTPNLDCTLGVREQLNQNSHFHDASQVYGSNKQTADSLRTFKNGLLKTSGDLLPKNSGTNAGCIMSSQARQCFRAGDVRVNQQPGLISMHTIWVKEHNRLAKRLAVVNPAWRNNDETLYQEARRIVIAMLQHITYNEYLPVILGDQAMRKYDLKPKSSGHYFGYDRSEKPMIRNGFSTAAFRFGHSMIRDKMPTHNGKYQTTDQYLKDVFLKPDLVYTRGVDEITRGLMRSKSEDVDKYLTAQVTRHLFERQHGFGGDLAAININRGRDHGLPHYKLWRRHCGLTGDYTHSPSVISALKSLYRDPEDMDLFTAGVSETPVHGAKVGPTFACLIGEQFKSLKKGDRFFYENDGQNGFTRDQLTQIRRVTMSKIICRNTGIDQIQRNAFKDVIPGNPLVGCRYIKDIDLAPWGSLGGGCIPVHGAWSSWKYTSCFGSFRIRYRLCDNPYPNKCGRPCLKSGQPFEIRMDFCGWWREPIWQRMTVDGSRQPRERISGAAAPDPEISANIMSQVEGAISKMIKPGQTSVDKSVFEKAISSVSATTNIVKPKPVHRIQPIERERLLPHMGLERMPLRL